MKEYKKRVEGIGYFGRKKRVPDLESIYIYIYIYIYITSSGLGSLMLMSDWLADG